MCANASAEREKAREVEKLYKKKIDKKERKQKKLVIGKRHETGSSGKTPHGVKMVDRRTKNDTRHQKMAEKRSKKKGGGGKHAHGKRKGGRQKKSGNYGRR